MAKKSIEAERRDFESHFGVKQDESGQYRHESIQNMWRGWWARANGEEGDGAFLRSIEKMRRQVTKGSWEL